MIQELDSNSFEEDTDLLREGRTKLIVAYAQVCTGLFPDKLGGETLSSVVGAIVGSLAGLDARSEQVSVVVLCLSLCVDRLVSLLKDADELDTNVGSLVDIFAYSLELVPLTALGILQDVLGNAIQGLSSSKKVAVFQRIYRVVQTFSDPHRNYNSNLWCLKMMSKLDGRAKL